MYTLALVWLGKFILWLSRLRGNAGSALPGLVIEKLSPRFITKMSKQLKGGSILVTGTNGKTTTTKIIKGILTNSGKRVVTNTTGSNMSRGIASALIEQANIFGRLRSDIGLFEVDEAFMADVAAKSKPKTIVVLNLLRDQLDRYGELDRTAQLIADSFPFASTIVLNHDDALVAGLAQHAESKKIIQFAAAPKLRAQLPDDASLLIKAAQQVETLIEKLQPVDILLSKAQERAEGQHLRVHYDHQDYEAELQLPGLYNAYNAMAALGAALSFNVGFKKAMATLGGIEPPFGRSETIKVKGKTLQLLLVKNPAGYNQVIKTFLLGPKRLPVLMALNDNFADGRDVSWIWDVNFEPLAAQEHKLLVSGLRAYDLALRLKYAGVSAGVQRGLAKSLETFIDSLNEDQVGYIVPTYTAMLKLRSLLGQKTDVKEVWK